MRVTSLLLAATLFSGISAHADTLSTFGITGTLQDATTVSGTILIDTTTGVYESGNLSYLGKAFNFTAYAGPNSSQNNYVIDLTTVPGTFPTYPQIFFGLSGTNLIGYAGGSICSIALSCNGGASTYEADGSSNDLFNVGAATFQSSTTTSVTPEPSSLILLSTGLLGLVGGVRRRFN